MSDASIQNRNVEFQPVLPGNAPGQQGTGKAAAAEPTAPVSPTSEQANVTTYREQGGAPSTSTPDSLLSAPSLPAPMFGLSDVNGGLSMEVAVIQAMGAGARTSQSQMNTQLSRQIAHSQDLKTIRDERIADMLDAAAQSEKAKKSQGLSKGLGTFAMVATLLVTAASLGTATPVTAALMVAGTAMTTVAGADGLSGGKLSEALGMDEKQAFAFQMALTVIGSVMTLGAGTVGNAMAKAGSKASTVGAKGVGQAGNLAKSSSNLAGGAAKGGANTVSKAAQQGQAQVDDMLSGSMMERLARMGSSSKNTTMTQQKVQLYQQRAAQFSGTTEVAASTADIPVVIHSHKASVARADAKSLKADATRVEAHIQQINSYVQTASRQLASNYQGMADAIATLRASNAAAFS